MRRRDGIDIPQYTGRIFNTLHCNFGSCKCSSQVGEDVGSDVLADISLWDIVSEMILDNRRECKGDSDSRRKIRKGEMI